MSERLQAAVALFVRDGRVLAVSRKTDHEDLGLVGGKLEPGESFEDAVVRETLEEVGVTIRSMESVFDWPDREFDARTFQILAWDGEPYAKEAAVVLWVQPQRLLEPSCSFRAYNHELFTRLRMI